MADEVISPLPQHTKENQSDASVWRRIIISVSKSLWSWSNLEFTLTVCHSKIKIRNCMLCVSCIGTSNSQSHLFMEQKHCVIRFCGTAAFYPLNIVVLGRFGCCPAGFWQWG